MSSKKSDEVLNQETLLFVGNLINGGVHAVAGVESQPEITLIRWQVMRVSDGDRLVGYNVEECEGRVSTPVMRFDPKTRLCMTSSGRCYQLMGDPSIDSDGNYVFSRVYRSSEAKDVTDEYRMAIEEARGEIP